MKTIFEFCGLFSVRIILIIVIVAGSLINSPKVLASSSTSVCNRAFNSYDVESGAAYASTAERYPNEKGEHCSKVEVAIWYQGIRRAYGSSNTGFVARFWYKDLNWQQISSLYSWHKATTNITKVGYMINMPY